MNRETGVAEIADDVRESFRQQGYLVLEGFLPDRLTDRLVPEVDRWMDEGFRDRSIASCLDIDTHGLPPLLELEMPAHGALLAFGPLLDLLHGVFGAPFVFHHLHSARHDPHTPGKPWHHDREAHEPAEAELLMVHALHYPRGLGATDGSLVVLPGSHTERREKTGLAHLGTASLPGEVVLSELPPGSTVVLDSALFHARRSDGRLPTGPRYFIDASYCQTGARWRPVKPYWRYMLAKARALGLDGGHWPELFAEHHFLDHPSA